MIKFITKLFKTHFNHIAEYTPYFRNHFMQIELTVIILLCVVAFFAGFVDAISGGGGLIQTPALLVLLPAHPVSSVLATVKLPSFSGTFFAARQFLKKVKLQLTLVALMCTIAFFASYAGSYLLLKVNNQFMKPVLLIILVIVAIYTFSKKNFGQEVTKYHKHHKKILLASTISLVIGFLMVLLVQVPEAF